MTHALEFLRCLVRSAAAAICLIAASVGPSAAQYPERPIRLLLPITSRASSRRAWRKTSGGRS
jgi:hypothetical protein